MNNHPVGCDYKKRPLKKDDRVIRVPVRGRILDARRMVYVDTTVTYSPPNFGRIMIDSSACSVVFWHKGREKGQLEVSSQLLKVPDSCWFNEEKTKAFIRLEGLAAEFGLD